MKKYITYPKNYMGSDLLNAAGKFNTWLTSNLNYNEIWISLVKELLDQTEIRYSVIHREGRAFFYLTLSKEELTLFILGDGGNAEYIEILDRADPELLKDSSKIASNILRW